MKTVTLNTAVQNLPELIKQTLDNQEETIIATDDGAVVMVDQKEWNNMWAHIDVMTNKRGMQALLDTLKRFEKDNFEGLVPLEEVTGEVTHELQDTL